MYVYFAVLNILELLLRCILMLLVTLYSVSIFLYHYQTTVNALLGNLLKYVNNFQYTFCFEKLTDSFLTHLNKIYTYTIIHSYKQVLHPSLNICHVFILHVKVLAQLICRYQTLSFLVLTTLKCNTYLETTSTLPKNNING